MNLQRFLLIDAALLDVAGVALLFAGETIPGLAVLVVAAIAFTAFLMRRRALVAG